MSDNNSLDGPNALTNIISTLRGLDRKEREWVLHSLASYFEPAEGLGGRRSIPTYSPAQGLEAGPRNNHFSEDRSASPKEFVGEKQPKTDVERVGCLAFYLTHYRNTPTFKTLDISALNTEAAQPKFSNASVAVDNATKTGYLIPSAAGSKQLSAAGERFVLALPDREAARLAMSAALPRRRRRAATKKTAKKVKAIAE